MALNEQRLYIPCYCSVTSSSARLHWAHSPGTPWQMSFLPLGGARTYPIAPASDHAGSRPPLRRKPRQLTRLTSTYLVPATPAPRVKPPPPVLPPGLVVERTENGRVGRGCLAWPGGQALGISTPLGQIFPRSHGVPVGQGLRPRDRAEGIYARRFERIERWAKTTSNE